MARRAAVTLCPLFVGVLLGCTHGREQTTPSTVTIPTPSVQVGNCGDPAHDGVMGRAPHTGHADRDLDGDGRAETIVADRAMCTPEGNCYWNVFTQPAAGCARYVGTLAGAALEPLSGKGEDNMTDVRGYWNLHGNRLLLQSYRFVRGGYQMNDVLLCKRASDDRLDCADTER